MLIRITLLPYIMLLLSLFFSSLSLAASPKIVWFSTLQQDVSDKSGFWRSVHDLVVATAQDLDINFRVYYAEENFLKMHEQVNKVLDNPETRPDGIIFHNYKKMAPYILKKAEALKVKSFIFNSGLNDGKRQLFPRQNYQHWVGQMLPDDEFAGAELLRCLKSAAQNLYTNSRKDSFTVLAMEGNPSSKAYKSRKIGLRRALINNPYLNFTQYFPADWSRSKAREMFPTMLARYPDVNIFWSANDNMALGLIDAAKNSDLIFGKNAVVGGIDWLSESIGAIKQGSMACSVGGHFVEGMWSLILMYDYINGFDFINESKKRSQHATLHTKMAAIDRKNVETFSQLAKKLKPENLTKHDFRQYSRTHNAKIERYNFSITEFLQQL